MYFFAFSIRTYSVTLNIFVNRSFYLPNMVLLCTSDLVILWFLKFIARNYKLVIALLASLLHCSIRSLMIPSSICTFSCLQMYLILWINLCPSASGIFYIRDNSLSGLIALAYRSLQIKSIGLLISKTLSFFFVFDFEMFNLDGVAFSSTDFISTSSSRLSIPAACLFPAL